MRRAPIVLTATAAGMAAVLGFNPRQPSVATTASTTPAAASTPAPSTASGSSSSSGSTGSSGSAAEKASEPTGTQTATGDAIDTQYGPAQVKVTVTDGKITDVQAVQLQGNEPKSVQISGSAAPLLRQSALDKQSGDIDAVSGATITSASYEASLQSALDRLGFEAADGSRGSSEIPQVEEHGGPDHF
jgi:uncharacterized protein with FMN-binding domain